eukprot:g1141.t1
MADWTLTVSFWQQMRHREVEHSVVTYGTVLAQLAWRTGALLLQELLSQVRLDPNVISYNCVMNACAEESRVLSERWERTLALSVQDGREMCAMELCPSLVSRNVVLSALAKAAEWPKALRWWEEMAEDRCYGRSEAMAASSLCFGSPPGDASPYRVSESFAFRLSSAVNACARARKWQMALSLLSSLRSTEVVPDTTTCNSAINACSSQWWHSFDLLCCMPSPDHLTYGSMLSACASQGLWPTCLEVLKFQQKHRVSPQLTSYTSTLAACHRSGQWLFAMLMVVSFSSFGKGRRCRKRISADVVGYNNLISACAQDAQWRRAMRLLHTDMPNSTLRPDSISFGGVIHACAERAQWQAALCLLETHVSPAIVDMGGAAPSHPAALHNHRRLLYGCVHPSSAVSKAEGAAVRCHCQVPCGIFHDDGRIAGILEDAMTIRKAVAQLVRWINTKEEHASKLMHTIAEYFLAQKVKKEQLSEHDYLQVLALHHAVLVAAMKTKQSSEMAPVDALDKAIQALRPVYEKNPKALETYAVKHLKDLSVHRNRLNGCLLVPQVYYVFEKGDPQQPQICRHVLHMDSIDHEFPALMKSYGLSVDLEGYWNHRSNDCHDFSPTRKTIKLVEDFYAQDYEAFGFSRDA